MRQAPKDDASGVLIIYTGGTIGSLPKDRKDPLSPLVPADLGEVLAGLPTYDVEAEQIQLGNTWIRLGTYAWEEPIDSSNISFGDWKAMADVIAKHYEAYEGFVVLHGTDTLAYTASALAFMLDNLKKPVVVTGSQLPIGRTRSDAVQNLVTSLEIAAARSLKATVVPEVTVFFRDRLLRGCRSTKMSASSFSAFDSPNCAPLVRAGEHLVARRVGPFRTESSAASLQVVDRLEANVASIGIFPGMNPQLLRNLLATKDLRGVVLQTFGTGNAPTTPEFLATLEEAVAAGKLIVNVTQCRSGTVEQGLYDASVGLLSRGVISGMDMTVEAALAKLFVVLGSESERAVAADMMQLDMRGEQRQSLFHLHFPAVTTPVTAPVTLRNVRPMVQGPKPYDGTRLDRAFLRVLGLQPMDVEGEDRPDGLFGHSPSEIAFKVYLDLPSANAETSEEGNPRFLGRTAKAFGPSESTDSGYSEENAFFTITRQARSLIDPRRTHLLTIVPLGRPFRWRKLALALFCEH